MGYKAIQQPSCCLGFTPDLADTLQRTCAVLATWLRRGFGIPCYQVVLSQAGQKKRPEHESCQASYMCCMPLVCRFAEI